MLLLSAKVFGSFIVYDIPRFCLYSGVTFLLQNDSFAFDNVLKVFETLLYSLLSVTRLYNSFVKLVLFF